MDLAALKNELTLDPLSRGYAAMSDEAASVSLNTQNRQPDAQSITGGMIAASVVRADMVALNAEERTHVRSLFAA